MYTAYQLGRTVAAPLNAWARGVQALWSNAGLPFAYTPVSRAMAAAGEVLERATRRYPKPPFGLTSTVVDGRIVAVRETVVLRTPFCDLLRFERAVPRDDPKVLLVAPLSGHHASLLRDTVATLLPDHDIHVTDWIDSRLVPLAAGGFDLDDYIDLMRQFIRHLGDGLHVIAVCQPAVATLAAVSLLAEDGDGATPRTLTLMGGPVDPRISPTEPNRLAESRSLEWFERTLVHRVPFGEPGALRRVYPGFLQLSGFLSMNLDRHRDSHIKLFKDLVAGDDASAETHRRFYDDYLAVMDMPAEYYLQTIATVFQRHDLPRGAMRYRGERRVDPGAIRATGLLTVEGAEDDITGVGQTLAAHALCAGLAPERKQHHLQPGAGHYGIFSGRRWRGEIAPLLRAHIRRWG